MTDRRETTDTGRAAIEQLLEAEQSLRASIVEAQHEAAAILERAAREAAAVARRAEQRTLAVHGRCAQSLDERLRSLGDASATTSPADAARERLDAAVASVARWLTGASDDHRH